MGKHRRQDNAEDIIIMDQRIVDAFTALDDEITQLKALREADAQAAADAVNARVAELKAERTTETAAPADANDATAQAAAAAETAAAAPVAAETAAPGFDVNLTAVHQ